MTNVARLHLAPWQRAVQTFMMQHFEYFLFMTKFLLMSEGHKRKHQSSLAAMIDFFTLTCVNRNYLQASYINHASNALSPLTHSSLERTDYAGCVYIFISVPLLMRIVCYKTVKSSLIILHRKIRKLLLLMCHINISLFF